jgi:protein N-lysine methyltransferase METTL21A
MIISTWLKTSRLAIARGCPGFEKPLHITDQENMLELMKQNITLNEMNGTVEASVYNWGEEHPQDLPEHPDIILAADCVYFEPAFPLLHHTLTTLIGPQTICYFCFKKRRRADMSFVRLIKKTFDVSEIDDDSDKESYRKESIYLYVMTGRRCVRDTDRLLA